MVKIKMTQSYGHEPSIKRMCLNGLGEMEVEFMRPAMIDRKNQNSRKTAGAVYYFALPDGIYESTEWWRFSKCEVKLFLVSGDTQREIDRDQVMDALMSGTAAYLANEVQ